jgi:hypothetical protein
MRWDWKKLIIGRHLRPRTANHLFQQASVISRLTFAVCRLTSAVLHATSHVCRLPSHVSRATVSRLTCLLSSFVLILGAAGAMRAETIDRLVATVNRQVITLSDIENDLKFQKLEAGKDASSKSPEDRKKEFEAALQRVIEQLLIRQQLQELAVVDVSEEEVSKQLTQIRKQYGEDRDWESLLKLLDISREELNAHIQWQLKVMKFLNNRFRPFVIVDQKEIETYYRETFVPELVRRQLLQPSLGEVEAKIQEILTEDKLNRQIEDWLRSLKSAANIQVMDEENKSPAPGH